MTTDKEKAYGAAVRILAVSDHTALALTEKLLRKGFSREDAVTAVDRLVSEGFLNEENLLEKTVARLYEKKYGPAYIRAEIEKKRFSKASKKRAEALIGKLDFGAAAKAFCEERKARGDDGKKIAAALIRRGFEPEFE